MVNIPVEVSPSVLVEVPELGPSMTVETPTKIPVGAVVCVSPETVPVDDVGRIVMAGAVASLPVGETGFADKISVKARVSVKVTLPVFTILDASLYVG